MGFAAQPQDYTALAIQHWRCCRITEVEFQKSKTAVKTIKTWHYVIQHV